jgi:thiol-disulfide isomerase/thioredoxin
MKRHAFYLPFVVLAFTAIIACSSSDTSEPGQADIRPKPRQTSNQNDFEFSAYDLDGNLRHSSEWIGKQPVVINVWGTWCPPCRREIPELVKLYDEYRSRGVEIIGFTVIQRERPSDVQYFAERNNMEWQLLVAEPDLLNRHQIRGVPTTFFLDGSGNVVTVRDADGVLRDRFSGPRSYEVFKAAFESIL